MKITRQVVAPIAIVALNYLGCTSAAKHVVDVGKGWSLKHREERHNVAQRRVSSFLLFQEYID